MGFILKQNKERLGLSVWNCMEYQSYAFRVLVFAHQLLMQKFNTSNVQNGEPAIWK